MGIHINTTTDEQYYTKFFTIIEHEGGMQRNGPGHYERIANIKPADSVTCKRAKSNAQLYNEFTSEILTGPQASQ